MNQPAWWKQLAAHRFSALAVGALASGGIVAMVLFGGFSADAKPSKAEARFANLAKEVVIPIEVQAKANPLAGNSAAAQEGMKIYQQSCSECHGIDGRSETSFGRAMYPPAMDLTSPHVRTWSDAELFWIVQNGVRFTGMPAWHSMLDQDSTWQVVLAMRELQRAGPKPVSADAAPVAAANLAHDGEILFRQEHCVGCHQLNGEGGKVGPDLTDQASRKRSNDWMTGHLKNPSAYVAGSIMPAANNLNEDQLRVLVAFLQGPHKK